MNTNERADVTLAREAFAKALRVQMSEVDVNIRDLSRRTRADGSAGIAETTIGKYVRAEITPRWTEQIQLADALGVDVGALLADAVVRYKAATSGEITR